MWICFCVFDFIACGFTGIASFFWHPDQSFIVVMNKKTVIILGYPSVAMAKIAGELLHRLAGGYYQVCYYATEDASVSDDSLEELGYYDCIAIEPTHNLAKSFDYVIDINYASYRYQLSVAAGCRHVYWEVETSSDTAVHLKQQADFFISRFLYGC